MTSNIVYIGVKARVAAIDKTSGKLLWQTKLKIGFAASGEGFVSLLVEDGFVYAHSYGQLFCLDAATGVIQWQNELEGLGYGIASLASKGLPTPPELAIAHWQEMRAESSAAATTTGSGVSGV